jgi:hypothetical protein
LGIKFTRKPRNNIFFPSVTSSFVKALTCFSMEKKNWVKRELFMCLAIDFLFRTSTRVFLFENRFFFSFCEPCNAPTFVYNELRWHSSYNKEKNRVRNIPIMRISRAHLCVTFPKKEICTKTGCVTRTVHHLVGKTRARQYARATRYSRKLPIPSKYKNTNKIYINREQRTYAASSGPKLDLNVASPSSVATAKENYHMPSAF